MGRGISSDPALGTVGTVTSQVGLARREKSALGLGHRCSDTRPWRRDAHGKGGMQPPPRPPHGAHLHSPVLLQPQEVFPAFGMDAVEDVAWVGALHGREVPSETPHQQERELPQRGPWAPVLPREGTGSVHALLRDREPGCSPWGHPAKTQEIRREGRKHVGNNANPRHILR